MTGHEVGAEVSPVLCVSPLGPDTATLLSAFGLLVDDRPELTLAILGGGPLEASVHRRAVDLGIDDRVQIRHDLSAAELHELAACSAVLVLPAPGREVSEGGGRLQRLLADALVTTSPMVVVGAAGPPRVLPGLPTVVLVPPDDPVILARALADLLGAPPSSPGVDMP
jgi:phosphatidylinositol alpha-1,6-mannosyltransferase